MDPRSYTDGLQRYKKRGGERQTLAIGHGARAKKRRKKKHPIRTEALTRRNRAGNREPCSFHLRLNELQALDNMRLKELEASDDMLDDICRRHYSETTPLRHTTLTVPEQHGMISPLQKKRKKPRHKVRVRDDSPMIRTKMDGIVKSGALGTLKWKSMTSIRMEARAHVDNLRENAEWEKEFWKEKKDKPWMEYQRYS
jgi:hypothetical protein